MKKSRSAEIVPTRTVPKAFFEDASPQEIGDLIAAQGAEKSAAIVAVLLQHYGPILGDKADRIVAKFNAEPDQVVKDLAIGAFRHLLKS